MTDPLTTRSNPRPSFSIPSILAIIAAVLSFRFGATLGLLLAIAAIVLGILGLLLSLSPRVRGGIVSVIGVVAGLIGIIAAIIKLIGGNF
jgi:hypothetical protein